MSRRCRLTRFAGAAFLLMGLSACVMTSTKDIAANPRAHAESDFFAPQRLQEAVSREILKGEAISPNFQHMTVTYAMEHQQYGRDDKVTVVVRLLNAGNGLVRLSHEFLRGTTSYGSEFALTYIGVVRLRTQIVRYNEINPSPIEEVTEFSRFSKNLAKPVENTEYVFDGSTALWLTPLSKHLPLVMTCRSQKFYPAATLHPDVRGDAIDLVCDEQSALGPVVRRYAFLRHYGAAVPLEAQTNVFKQIWTISRFEVM